MAVPGTIKMMLVEIKPRKFHLYGTVRSRRVRSTAHRQLTVSREGTDQKH